ncbi:DUF72 domain-containing protein [Burkholderia glumae]|uniref:DUF72 domain-containing protein n=1 Tax=Burkholderia glumae TaxID=337 RepID=UPI000C2744A4|nr:DUF72 domain-containing protein [Burkholderia glumae]PJO24154.1 DUF72 domain-containing protein [Burkholderia glumae AU6208]QHE11083.1 DUF72 domain-containing protein [Burkholderia glumae AU6208]
MADGSTQRDAARTIKHDRAAHEAEQFDLFGAPPPGPVAEPAADGGPPAPVARGHAGHADAAPCAAAGSSTPGAASRHTAPVGNDTAAPASLWGDEALPPQSMAADTAAGPAAAPRRSRKRAVARAAISDELAAIAAALPPNLRLGTSTWSFPGWNGIVYGDDYSAQKLSRDGLDAYGAHPLLRSVSIDRSFYAPLPMADYLRYAQQVPDDFRFVVKAPASVTDAVVRGPRGEPAGPNPAFLDARIATDDFVRPCLDGLGRKAGALVFQFSPLPDALLADPAALIERLAAFFAALPPLPDGGGEADGPRYAIEIRDASLLTPRFIRTLAAAGVRYCVGLHARMPDPLRQAAALALLDGDAPGPLVVRWSLHGGFKYEQAKAKYDPFDRLVDEDPHTRQALADLAARYVLAGQPVLITINNKAEGSAPLSCIELAKAIGAALERLRADPA